MRTAGCAILPPTPATSRPPSATGPTASFWGPSQRPGHRPPPIEPEPPPIASGLPPIAPKRRVDREHARAALRDAHLDELTGTYRRGMGSHALEREIDRARRGTGRLVLAFVDVDDLKTFNDREGHAAGDALLVNVVTAMRSRLRSYDPVIRFGGDEFVCALADADLVDAHRRFDEIQQALGQRSSRLLGQRRVRADA